MSDQVFNPNRDNVKQERELKINLNNYFKRNPSSAFTFKALINRIEDIVHDPNDIEYAKENLQIILDKLTNSGVINKVQQDGEEHYVLQVGKKERANLNLEPLKESIRNNRFNIFGFTVLLGIVIGLMQFVGYVTQELLIAMTVIIITISVIGEIVIISNLSKKNLKYSVPIYGILALTLGIIGSIIIGSYSSFIFWGIPSWDIMIGLPFAIFAIICGAAGLYNSDVEHVAISTGGLFLGGILLVTSLFPLLYYALSFVAILFH
ncbi:MAG: hypothetical protein ACW986_19710 [Promethearchaeota archaeon]|jgi:membrane-associated HD superfamily phosphohydrolase